MQKPEPERLLVGLPEAAHMLDVSYATINRMIESGEIPANQVRKIGGQRKINRRFVLSLAGEESK